MALTQAQFDALVQTHGPTLYRIAYRLVGDRHEAEDVVQETFRSAWTSRNYYQEGRGDRAWLVSILRRRVVDRWRRQRPAHKGEDSPRLTVVPAEILADVSVEGQDPLADDYTDEMQRALAQLPDELRQALLLVVVGELTHQEAADELQIPLGTVLSRVSRARNRLREYLTANKASKV